MTGRPQGLNPAPRDRGVPQETEEGESPTGIEESGPTGIEDKGRSACRETEENRRGGCSVSAHHFAE